MRYLIDYLDEDPQTVATIDAVVPQGVALSIVTYMEVFQGTLRKPDAARAQRELAAFVRDVPILPFSPAVAERCARLRHDLDARGRRVRPRALDLVTAAIALEFGLTLMTRNRADFADVPGVQLHP